MKYHFDKRILVSGGAGFVGSHLCGDPNEFTINELPEMIIKLTGSKSKIIHAPLPKDDPLQRRPDISLAQKKLGWTPKIKLQEGLERTIKYFCEIL